MKYIIGFLIVLFTLPGCASRDGYYDAVREQNITVQLNNAKAERQLDYTRDQKQRRREEHQERMLIVVESMIRGVAKTPDKTDDVMGPLLVLMMQDKWALAEVIDASNDVQVASQPMQKIEAPAEGVDYLKAGLPLIGSLAAVAIGWHSLDKIADVAASAGANYYMSGDNNKLNQDSQNTGSYNVAGGDQTIDANSDSNDYAEGATEEEIVEDLPLNGSCAGAEGTFVDDEGYVWVADGCSCNSWIAGHCADSGGNYYADAGIDVEEEEES